jgi:hypothetical protein
VTTLKRISLLLALCACLAAAGCGSDNEKGKPIPTAQAQELQTRLTEAERRLADGSVGACRDILRDTKPTVRITLASIPSSVAPDVRDALSQSFDNLWSLVDDECRNLQPDKPTQTETTTQPETTSTPTETQPTETTPPATDTTPTTPGTETQPPDGNGTGGAIPPNGNGNGNGGGVGPGAAKQKKEKNG